MRRLGLLCASWPGIAKCDLGLQHREVKARFLSAPQGAINIAQNAMATTTLDKRSDNGETETQLRQGVCIACPPWGVRRQACAGSGGCGALLRTTETARLRTGRLLAHHGHNARREIRPQRVTLDQPASLVEVPVSGKRLAIAGEPASILRLRLRCRGGFLQGAQFH